MKLTLTRILRTAFGKQPNEPVDLHQTSADRSTHPGHLSVDLCVYMLMKKELFDFFSGTMNDYITVEAGAGPGYFSMAASILGGKTRTVLAIERDQCRIRRLVSWKETLMREENIEESLLPEIVEGDFTKDIDQLQQALTTNRLAVYVNNFNNALGTAQALLEYKLSPCLPGTIVIALYPMLTSEMTWREERFVAIVPREHVSWSRNGTDGLIPLKFYKYTKLEAPEGTRRARGDGSEYLEIQYCFLKNNYL